MSVSRVRREDRHGDNKRRRSRRIVASFKNMELGLVLALLLILLSIVAASVCRLLEFVPRERTLLLNNYMYWHQHWSENLNVARSKFAVAKSTNKPEAMQRFRGGRTGNGVGVLNIPNGAPEENIHIPPHKWPVSIGDADELNNTEALLHPGDQTTILQVPKFWSLPVHNFKLMTREKALSIGSCAEPDGNGNVARGADCPLHQRTIFVAIASYRDFQCRTTIESIFQRAKHPQRIRVGVVDQIVGGQDPGCNEPVTDCTKDPKQALCIYKNHVDVFTMEAKLAVGPVFARHIGHRLYRGEYYALQSDAHVTFTTHWDVNIIDQLEQTHNEMAVLTTHLMDVQGSINATTGRSLVNNTRPITCNVVFEGGPQGMHLRHASQPLRMPGIHGTPQLQPWWVAGHSFSRGHFVVNVPYDPYLPMIFQGEEMSIGLRAFSVGYDFYAPKHSVCFHHYAVGKNAAMRNKVKHFWENGKRYSGSVGKAAMTRLLGIVRMNPETPQDSWNHKEEDIYGLGAVRTPESFYHMFGIDVVHKTVEGHLCEFVDGNAKMHKMFVPHLRPDGMGIDYDKIKYQFHDPLASRMLDTQASSHGYIRFDHVPSV